MTRGCHAFQGGQRQRRFIIQPTGCEARATLGLPSSERPTLKELHLLACAPVRFNSFRVVPSSRCYSQGSSCLATHGLTDAAPSAQKDKVLQDALLAAVEEGLHDDVAARGGGKDGQPRDDDAGDEMRGVWLKNPLAAAHGGRQSEATELPGQVRSQSPPLGARSMLTIAALFTSSHSPGSLVHLRW